MYKHILCTQLSNILIISTLYIYKHYYNISKYIHDIITITYDLYYINIYTNNNTHYNYVILYISIIDIRY